MKKIFAAGLALLGMGVFSTAQNVSVSNSQNNVRYDKRNQNKESQPIQSQKTVNQKTTKQNSKGYTGRTYFNQGIPPKIYGMYCVKRGTHKRSNKA